jgi:hypothetical protein
MSRPRTRPQETITQVTVWIPVDAAERLTAMAKTLGLRSWRSLLGQLGDGKLCATRREAIPPIPSGAIDLYVDLRSSQAREVRRLCTDLGAHARGKPSPSVLLVAIAAGAVTLHPADPPSAEG